MLQSLCHNPEVFFFCLYRYEDETIDVTLCYIVMHYFSDSAFCVLCSDIVRLTSVCITADFIAFHIADGLSVVVAVS